MTHRHDLVQHLSVKPPIDKAKRQRMQEELKKRKMPSDRGVPEVRDQPLLQSCAKRRRRELAERAANAFNKALHRHGTSDSGSAAVDGGESQRTVRLDPGKQPRLWAKFGNAPLTMLGWCQY